MRSSCNILMDDLAHETKALAVDRPNELLPRPVIAEGQPCRAHPAGYACIRNNASRPHDLRDFILADHSRPIPDKMDDERQNLRFNVNRFAAPGEFEPIWVESIIAKLPSHATYYRETGQIFRKSSAMLQAQPCWSVLTVTQYPQGNRI